MVKEYLRMAQQASDIIVAAAVPVAGVVSRRKRERERGQRSMVRHGTPKLKIMGLVLVSPEKKLGRRASRNLYCPK